VLGVHGNVEKGCVAIDVLVLDYRSSADDARQDLAAAATPGKMRNLDRALRSFSTHHYFPEPF